MRKASEILDSYLQDLGGLSDHQYHWLKIAINEARTEAIQECAKVADVTGFDTFWEVDKDSILELLNQIK